MPNLAYLYTTFLGVSINKYVWISQSLNIFFSSSFRLISTFEECLKSNDEFDYFECDFGTDYVFPSIFLLVALDFNFEQYISRI